MKLKIFIIIVFVVIFLIIGVFVYKNGGEEDGYNLKIYFWNAGKADAILISNNDRYIMIDTGEESLSNNILQYFKNNGIEMLDYLIITHFDKDHVGSASSIIDNIEVKNVLQSNYPKDSEYYNKYISSLANKGIEAITVSNDLEFELEDLSFIVNRTNYYL